MIAAVRILLGCLAFAAVYFAGGLLAHSLALPPTMVIPIWPSAGIALLVLALWGRRWWPGIALGSVLFNAHLSVDTMTGLEWLIAGVTGIGAAMQALVGLWLLQRVTNRHVAPVSTPVLMQQALLAGPIACVIAPLWSTASRVLLMQLPAASAVETAAISWLANALGVIALLPLLYVWQTPKQPLSSRRRWALSCTVLLIAGLVALTALHLRERELAQWQAQQSVIHSRVFHRFEQQQTSAQQALMMVRALFVSSQWVTREEFHNFAREQLSFANGVSTLEWVPRVSGDERAAFELQQRGNEPAFEIRQQSAGVLVSALPRNEYFPITYVEPLNGNRGLLGLDLLSEPNRAEFVRRVQHSRQFQVSEPLRLAQQEAAGWGVLAGVPYPASDSQDNDLKNKPLDGLLVAVIDVESMLNNALAGDEAAGLHLQIWMEDVDGHSQSLLRWPAERASAAESGRGIFSADHQLAKSKIRDDGFNKKTRSETEFSQTIFSRQFGDRRWQIAINSEAERAPSLQAAWLMLIIGVSLSAALGIYLLSSSHYTARVEAEVAERTQELSIARDQAVAASHAKSQFLASMSHEIRTPLTAIMGYTELMIDDPHTPVEVRAPLQVVLDSSRTLLTLINDVLDLSKIEAGHMQLALQPCSVLSVVQEVVRLLQPRAEQKQLLLLTDYRFPLPSSVNTDALRLRQILLNLLGNAIKFTEVGQIQLQLSAEVAGQYVQFRIAISDTGVGIDPAHQQRVFEPFEQIQTGDNRRYGGTGLGLAIARQLARLLGGDIRLHSAPGQGSTFILEFRAERLDENVLVSEFERAQIFETTRQRAHFSGQVLVAEDNAVNAKLATQLLQSCGVQVDLAGDGLIALSMLERARQLGTPYDLVFMDMQMPRMDGYEAVQKLRAAGFVQPVVALTANAMSGDRERCLAAGCDAFASKPFQRSEIETLLRQFLRLKPYD